MCSWLPKMSNSSQKSCQKSAGSENYHCLLSSPTSSTGRKKLARDTDGPKPPSWNYRSKYSLKRNLGVKEANDEKGQLKAVLLRLRYEGLIGDSDAQFVRKYEE